jgi:mannose-6-phosphate isomerase-like protein (cupin superfamily)
MGTPTLDEIKSMGADEREAYHRSAEAQIKTFDYAPPPPNQRPKQIVRLVQSDCVEFGVQVVREGGENNLHFHVHSDTTWMVIGGRARFYGPDNAVIGEFGRMQGLLMPGGARYWFEKVGDEPLEILQMVGFEKGPAAEKRVNVEARKAWMDGERFDASAPAP